MLIKKIERYITSKYPPEVLKDITDIGLDIFEVLIDTPYQSFIEVCMVDADGYVRTIGLRDCIDKK